VAKVTEMYLVKDSCILYMLYLKLKGKFPPDVICAILWNLINRWCLQLKHLLVTLKRWDWTPLT